MICAGLLVGAGPAGACQTYGLVVQLLSPPSEQLIRHAPLFVWTVAEIEQMSLVELAPIGVEALPIGGFRDHLRLGSGFADDGLQDAVLEAYLRGALSAVEGLVGKALFTRGFRWEVEGWLRLNWQPMPLRPVTAVNAVEIEDAFGNRAVADPGQYRLRPSGERQALCGVGAGVLPPIPDGGHGIVDFEAGYGAGWGDLPAELRQAVMILAAHYYEARAGQSAHEGIPPEVRALTARHRPVRLGGGGGA